MNISDVAARSRIQQGPKLRRDEISDLPGGTAIKPAARLIHGGTKSNARS
jgi:hypothetical protein